MSPLWPLSQQSALYTALRWPLSLPLKARLGCIAQCLTLLFQPFPFEGYWPIRQQKRYFTFNTSSKNLFFESHLAFIERASQNHELTTEITTVIVFPFFSLPSHINRMRAFSADFRKIGKFLNWWQSSSTRVPYEAANLTKNIKRELSGPKQ